jgi:excinuclease ABC subunit A
VTGLEQLDKVINVDQSPIGRTPRSNPATYTGLFTPIRELFAGVPESRQRGYDAGRFSFNVKGGRCEACQGDGVTKVEMHFLADIYVACDVCHGKRYNRETLEIRYKGRNIHEVLEMTVTEALEFFSAVPAIARKLKTLIDVGLGYVRLGQSATTLSGGEAQRVKLSLELSKRDTGRTLYILDEPTTGLHFHDIKLLLEVLMRLRDAGNTVVVIEHNMDVIKTADWIIDLGPEGGEAGGRIVAEGPPERVAANKASHTGAYLCRALASAPAKDAAASRFAAKATS